MHTHTHTHLVLGDEPARIVRVLVDEELGLVRAGEQENRPVAWLQEGPSCTTKE